MNERKKDWSGIRAHSIYTFILVAAGDAALPTVLPIVGDIEAFPLTASVSEITGLATGPAVVAVCQCVHTAVFAAD